MMFCHLPDKDCVLSYFILVRKKNLISILYFSFCLIAIYNRYQQIHSVRIFDTLSFMKPHFHLFKNITGLVSGNIGICALFKLYITMESFN